MVKKTLLGGGLAFVLALVGGCGGSGGNNDQGIVFRATGIFRTQTNITTGDPPVITCTEPIVGNSTITDVSGTISLSNTRFYPDRVDPAGDPCGGELALVNNLSSQSINVQFVTIKYQIAGAAVAVDDNVVNTGFTISPATCEDCQFSSGQPGLIFLALRGQLVPQRIITFLNVNVNRLPVPPFQMDLFITASGQSDQGTNYETNEVGYTLTVED